MHTNALPKTAKMLLLSGTLTATCLLLVAGLAWAGSPVEQGSAQADARSAASSSEKFAMVSQAKQRVTSSQSGPAQASVQASAQGGEWGPYLDVAYQLTYWDKSELKKWREEVESRFSQKLSDYLVAWNAKLMQPAAADGAGAPERGGLPYGEQDYLRLAAALTLNYLETDNRGSLNGAEQVLDRLKEKSAMPRVAYWLGFVQALQALENKDSAAFVAQTYAVWNNALRYMETAVMAVEQAEGGTAESAGDASIPHLYRNMVSLVARRAIIDRKLEGLDALGPLFAMMKQRNMEETAADGRYLTTLVQRVNEIFIAPDLDRWRLNFAVALIEARRLQRVAEGKLDTERMSEEARQVFEQSREYFDHALNWGASRRSSGAVAIMADYLDITSFAVQRLLDPANAGSPAFAYFASLEGQQGEEGAVTLKEAMSTFKDLAVEDGWEKGGFGNKESYQPSMDRLWRSFMELSLWNGDYYLAQLKAPGAQQDTIGIAASLQGALTTYLDFFTAQADSKAVEVVPASAYFGAAEAAEKLSYAYRLSDNYSMGQAGYNRWFVNRLLAVELYPFDAALVADTASALKRDGRYDLFIDYFLPLAERFKKSPLLLALQETKPENEKKPAPAASIAAKTYIAAVDGAFAVSARNPGKGVPDSANSLSTLRRDLQRNPEHETHKLLKAFYREELGNQPPITYLLKDPNRLGQE